MGARDSFTASVLHIDQSNKSQNEQEHKQKQHDFNKKQKFFSDMQMTSRASWEVSPNTPLGMCLCKMSI